jgi:hypothetical protein
MGYKVRNISKGYAYLLKEEVAPGAVLDLEKIFQGFCKPKMVARSEKEPRHIEYTKDQFPEFLDKVRNEWAADRGTWSLELPDNLVGDAVSPVPSSPSRKNQKRKTAIENRKSQRKMNTSDVTPKEMAWMPFSKEAESTVNNCSDARKLKMAHKLVRNLAGQERVRKLIEDRIAELNVDGVV